MSTPVMRLSALALLVACNSERDAKTVQVIATQHNVTELGVVEQSREVGADGWAEAAPAGDAVELRLGAERLFLPAGDSRSPLDLSRHHFGRGDVQLAAARTPVEFELAGLSAWQAGDQLQLVAPNTGLTLTAPEESFASYPSAGSTTLRGQRLDWRAALAPLVDASKGDTTWVTQLVAAPPAPGTAGTSILARAGIARGFTTRDGQPATLTASLAPVAPDRRLALHWRGAQFAALAAQAGPDARPAPAVAVSIKTLPAPLARTNNFFTSHYAGLPVLVEFGPIPGAADLDQTVRYGNPFSSARAPWTELVVMTYAASVPVPSATGIGALPAMMITAVPAGERVELAPAISPVRNVAAGGRSLAQPRTGAGTAPTLTWDAPAIGTATNYAVVVHAVDAGNDGVRLTKLASFYTRGTRLQLPDAVLAPGGSYVFTITAISAPGADLAARPFVGALPYASADYVTAQLQP